MLDLAILGILSTYKKMQSILSWSSYYFKSESSEKSILTDKCTKVLYVTYEPTVLVKSLVEWYYLMSLQ